MTRLVRAAVLALLFPFLVAAQPPEPEADEPEEPDFFFLTGGPYTQKKNSPQVIWANQWFFDREGPERSREFTGAGRAEWGLTDRLEVDFEFGALALRQRAAGVTTFSESGAADLLLGVRYRLLREGPFPFTLTTGPQISAPVASRRRGLGTGEVTLAWDLAVAKDWGGPVYLAASANLSVTPDAASFPDGSGPDFGLTTVESSVALGWRALERKAATGGHHDIHVFFEVAAAREEETEAGARVRSTPVAFSPGFRYGFLSRGGRLAEIGLAFPAGLNRAAPDWGVILQVQFELPPVF